MSEKFYNLAARCCRPLNCVLFVYTKDGEAMVPAYLCLGFSLVPKSEVLSL